jgi:hypothetical protein
LGGPNRLGQRAQLLTAHRRSPSLLICAAPREMTPDRRRHALDRPRQVGRNQKLAAIVHSRRHRTLLAGGRLQIERGAPPPIVGRSCGRPSGRDLAGPEGRNLRPAERLGLWSPGDHEVPHQSPRVEDIRAGSYWGGTAHL